MKLKWKKSRLCWVLHRRRNLKSHPIRISWNQMLKCMRNTWIFLFCIRLLFQVRFDLTDSQNWTTSCVRELKRWRFKRTSWNCWWEVIVRSYLSRQERTLIFFVNVLSSLSLTVALKIIERIELVNAIGSCMARGDSALLAGISLLTESLQRELQQSSTRPAQYKMPPWLCS